MAHQYKLECLAERADPLLVYSENRAKVIFENQERKNLFQIKVDGCEINEGERCDWLLVVPDQREYFIELKGTNVKKAFAQLTRSVEILAQTKSLAICISARAIPTKANNDIRVLMVKFRKRFPNTRFYINSGDVTIKL